MDVCKKCGFPHFADNVGLCEKLRLTMPRPVCNNTLQAAKARRNANARARRAAMKDAADSVGAIRVRGSVSGETYYE